VLQTRTVARASLSPSARIRKDESEHDHHYANHTCYCLCRSRCGQSDPATASARRQAEFSNQAAGLVQLCQQLKTIPHIHVVVWKPPVAMSDCWSKPCTKRKFPSRSPTPHKCAAAGQAQGQRAKTDRIDAALLTDYGQRYQPKPTSPTTASQDQLVALTQWLMQLSRHKPWPKRRPNITKRPLSAGAHTKLMAHYQSQIVAVEKTNPSPARTRCPIATARRLFG